MIASDEGAKLAEQFTRPAKAVFATGFAEIDYALRGGVRAGETTLLSGFTGQSKSAFAEQWALSASIEIPTLYIPLELGEDETRLRMGAKLARVSVDVFRRTGLDLMTRQALSARDLTLYRPREHTIGKIRQIVAKGRHKLFFIDDCRSIDGVTMDSSSKSSNAHVIAKEITRIAEEYGVHIVELQQLASETFNRGPDQWRVQDSTLFEQRAYNSITVYRPFANHGEQRDTVLEARIRKSRSGPRAKIHYRWHGDTMSVWAFSQIEKDNLECCKPRKARTV